jgi:hypothetical protein
LENRIAQQHLLSRGNEVLAVVRKVLEFKVIAVDDIRLEAGTTLAAGAKLSTFTDYGDLNGDVVTSVDEPTIMRHLLSSSARGLILNELRISHYAAIWYEVKEPVVERGDKPGDIDVLICDQGLAAKAIGLQCKRVKIEALNQEKDKANKLSDLAGGVRQVNLQRNNLGFHRNYLVIIIQTFGPLRSQSNVLFRGPTHETFKKVYEFDQRESLHEDAGILFIEITQPTRKSYQRMYEIGVCLDKEAKLLEQMPRLTNRIRELIRTNQALSR